MIAFHPFGERRLSWSTESKRQKILMRRVLEHSQERLILSAGRRGRHKNIIFAATLCYDPSASRGNKKKIPDPARSSSSMLLSGLCCAELCYAVLPLSRRVRRGEVAADERLQHLVAVKRLDRRVGDPLLLLGLPEPVAVVPAEEQVSTNAKRMCGNSSEAAGLRRVVLRLSACAGTIQLRFGLGKQKKSDRATKDRSLCSPWTVVLHRP